MGIVYISGRTQVVLLDLASGMMAMSFGAVVAAALS
jgi:hypothetical protein